MTKLDELFDISVQTRAAMPQSTSVPLGIDTHVHGRNDARSKMVINMCTGEFEAIVDIANVPKVDSIDAFKTRRQTLESLVPQGKKLRIYTCPLICNTTDPAMLVAAWRQRLIAGVKIFWEGVSNAYGQFITSAEAIKPLICTLPKGFVVTVHAECLKDNRGIEIPIRNREHWCIVNEVNKMVRWNQGLIYIIRHVSDYRTLDWIESMWHQGYRIFAELSPQYLIQIDDDLFRNDEGHAVLNCDCIYWPRPKDIHSRTALQEILLRCPPWLIYGSDLAMHLHDPTQLVNVKVNAEGKAVGGLTFLPAAAKSILIDFCVSHGKTGVLRQLLVDNPSSAYGIKLEGTEVEYVRKDWTVPDYIHGTVVDEKLGNRPVKSINFLRGQTMHWQQAV